MNSENILELALGFESKVKILRFFSNHPGIELTKREIARMTGISHNAVNIAMRDLIQTNLFIFKPAGNAHMYSLNTECALLPVIKSLFEGESRLRKDLITTVQNGLQGVGTCIIFGSYARQEETLGSDLDLLILTDDKRKAKTACDRMLLSLRTKFDVFISPIILTMAEFERKKNKPVYKNALLEGMVIMGERPEV